MTGFVEIKRAKKLRQTRQGDMLGDDALEERLSRGEWAEQLAENIHCLYFSSREPQKICLEVPTQGICDNCKVKAELLRQAQKDKRGSWDEPEWVKTE